MALFHKGYGKEGVVHTDHDNQRWSAPTHQGYRSCLRPEPAHQVLIPQDAKPHEESPLVSLAGGQSSAYRHKRCQRPPDRVDAISRVRGQIQRSLHPVGSLLPRRPGSLCQPPESPYSHRGTIRTTNLIERSFVEEKDQGDTGIFYREVRPQVGIFKFNKGSQEMAQDHFHQSRTCSSWTGSGMNWAL